jgi:hypothetical protein
MNLHTKTEFASAKSCTVTRTNLLPDQLLRRSVTHARGAIQVEPNGETEVPQQFMKYSRRFDVT